MPRFRVMLRCEQMVIDLNGTPADGGFSTTRAVHATSKDEARSRALAMVRKDLASRTAKDPDALNIEVDEVEVVPWWWRRLHPPAGFTFFVVRPEVKENELRGSEP